MLRQAPRNLFPSALKGVFSRGILFGAMGILSVAIATTAQATDSDSDAMAYVQQMSDQGFEILNREDLDMGQRAAAFRGLVKTSFDFERIGMFALSKHRRQASEDEVATFLQAFEDYAINIYQSRLGEYSGERLEVTGSTIRRETKKAKEVIVHSQVAFADGSAPWEVNWRVFARDGRYQIVDIQVVGIWMAMEQRAQFSSIIAQEKGSVAALTRILQKHSGATVDL